MTPYELTNDQRQYFALIPVAGNWEKHLLSDDVTIYFDKDKIVKILNYSWGYLEYDTDIDTKDKLFILPKTANGKAQTLTAAKLLKVKGSGIQFSGSFKGGGIHIYDNKRHTSFIKSFPQDAEIKTFEDIDNWISIYVSKLPANYFDWLKTELAQKRLKVKVKQGDIIAFRISQSEYGFARVLSENYGFYHSVIVVPYAYYADTLQTDIENLINNKTLPPLCIFDVDIYRGAMPIIGNRPLSTADRQIQFLQNHSISITIPYTKADIKTFIANKE